MAENETLENISKFPSYPVHGIIGNSEPAWMNIFYSTEKLKKEPKQNFRKQKFDFHEMYENFSPKSAKISETIIPPTPIPGLWNLWRNFNAQKTSAVYQVDPSLPERFNNPGLLRGYGCEKDGHPLFQTTSSAYGRFPPTIHDVPREYHALKNAFTTHIAGTGMPKNRSLNIK